MTNPKGYVSLLERDKLHTVPAIVDNVKDLIMLLASVWRAKKMVMDCMEIVKEEESNLPEEDFMQQIIDGRMTPPHSVSLPWSFDTPSKSKHRR